MYPKCPFCNNDTIAIAWNSEWFGSVAVDIPCEFQCTTPGCPGAQPNPYLQATGATSAPKNQTVRPAPEPHVRLLIMNEKTLKEAWRLRQIGCYTMRDIADKLGVECEDLIKELNAYLNTQPNTSVKPTRRKRATRKAKKL